MREIFAKSNEIVLGKRGEKNAVCVMFSITDWLRDYGEGDITLIHQRNGDTYPYPCVIEREGDVIRWVITATETAKAGRGKAELQLVQDGTIAKSITYVTRVLHSLAPPSENPPEPGEGWIEKILELINNGGGGCDCEPYELPIASANTLGGVKIGEGLEISGEGVLKAIHTEKKLSSVVVTETAGDVTFTSTFADGTTKVRVITKGADGNPNGMTDDGREIAVSWTEVDA